jgi:perosamine synthetase
MRKFIPVSEPQITDLEKFNVNKVLDSGWISSTGEFVDKFEKDWSVISGTDKCLSVANGTVALHLILAALGIGPNDEVIVPTLTFIASVNAIKYVGANPVFCDVNLETWCMEVDEVKRLFTEKTRAIICVHLYGNPCDLVNLRKFCDDKEIYLIEDAAEAPFASINNKSIGSFGDASSFSFYGNKIISSGEGGAVTTSNLALYDKMKLLRSQGMDPNRRYFFPEIGFNYRLTNLQCAILCAQIARKEEILYRRREIFDLYDSFFSSIDFIKKQIILQNAKQSPWLYTILVSEELEDNLQDISNLLFSRGIETRPVFIPIHTLPPYESLTSEAFPNSTQIAKRGISLPTSNNLSNSEIQYVSNNLIEVCKQFLN